MGEQSAKKAARGLLWIVAVVGGLYVLYLLLDAISLKAYDGDLSDQWIALGVLAAFALAVLGLTVSYSDNLESATPVIFVIVVVGISLGYRAYTNEENAERLVGDYCAYAASSMRQLARCQEEVKPGYVLFSNTPAAEFARGRRNDCGPGAGPYCEEAVMRREYESFKHDGY